MQFNIYEVIIVSLFEFLIIYDLFRVIKLKKYDLLWIPVIVDMVLLVLISILLYTVFNMTNDYKSVAFAKMYLLQCNVQLLGWCFSFIRVVLIERLKRK